jgi:hypothetical protein
MDDFADHPGWHIFSNVIPAGMPRIQAMDWLIEEGSANFHRR